MRGVRRRRRAQHVRNASRLHRTGSQRPHHTPLAHEHHTKAPEGATTGGVVGLGLGAGLGWLAGIGALAIPGVGPFIAAGPIMAALGGAAVGTATGGIIGALVGMGIPEYEAKRYEGRVKDGGVLLSVHCDSSEEVSRAKDVLKAAGANDVSSSGEKSVSTHGVETNDADKNRLNTGTVRSGRLEDERVDRDVIETPTRVKTTY